MLERIPKKSWVGLVLVFWGGGVMGGVVVIVIFNRKERQHYDCGKWEATRYLYVPGE